jgi:LysM repeat protein
MAITGHSPLFAPPSVTEKRFVRRLREGKSPAADEAASIYRRMVNNGFDPLIALGQFQAESNLGTKGHAKDTLNWGNILFYEWTKELGAVDHAPGNGFHYSKFPSWTQGARAYIRLMKAYDRRGFDTVETMAAHWLGDKPGTPRTNRYVDNILGACARFAAPPAKAGGSAAAPAPKPPAPAKPKTPPKTYVVKPGDTLSGIAKRELGASSRWTEIYKIAQNRTTIGNDPGLIRAGQRLILPTL